MQSDCSGGKKKKTLFCNTIIQLQVDTFCRWSNSNCLHTSTLLHKKFHESHSPFFNKASVTLDKHPLTSGFASVGKSTIGIHVSNDCSLHRYFSPPAPIGNDETHWCSGRWCVNWYQTGLSSHCTQFPSHQHLIKDIRNHHIIVPGLHAALYCSQFSAKFVMLNFTHQKKKNRQTCRLAIGKDSIFQQFYMCFLHVTKGHIHRTLVWNEIGWSWYIWQCWNPETLVFRFNGAWKYGVPVLEGYSCYLMYQIHIHPHLNINKSIGSDFISAHTQYETFQNGGKKMYWDIPCLTII